MKKIKREGEDFTRKIIELYQEARRSKFVNKKIKRGRSHSISSIAEDLFAEYLAKNIKCDEILVDPPIKIDSIKKYFYPDVAVIKNGEIVLTFDLKMDMGYIRDYLDILCKNGSDNVKKFCGKKCYTNIPTVDYLRKDKKEYFFSSKLRHNIIIVSGRNVNSNKLKKGLENAEKYEPDVKVFVLTDKKHPNEYGYTAEKLMDEIDIKDESFKEIKEM